MTTIVRLDTAELGSLIGFEAAGETVSAFRARTRQVVADELTPLVAAAERDRTFPRAAVAALGAAGLLRERWSGGTHGDVGKSVVIGEELGRAGVGGLGVGISLHLEAAGGLLARFGRSAYAQSVFDRALSGEAVCCVATSEQTVGSDLSSVRTTLTKEGAGWRVQGTKWFVSPGADADFALVLCSGDRGPALVLVPKDGLTVLKRLQTVGMRGLGTSRLAVDAHVDDDAVLAAPGLGLAALMCGLLYERLAIAALTLGALELVTTLATSHLRVRQQFGVPLHEHQALRLRMADLVAQTELARRGMRATAAELAAGGPVGICEVAGVKATVARLAERVVSECMHVFGGRGYLEDEAPMARLWRDLRVGRVGGGSDEMMWELVASGFRVDEELYHAWMNEPDQGPASEGTSAT